MSRSRRSDPRSIGIPLGISTRFAYYSAEPVDVMSAEPRNADYPKLCALVAFLACALSACGTGQDAAELVGIPIIDEPAAESMSPLELQTALDVMARMNTERAEVELPAYVWDDAVTDVAYDHAVDMRLRDYYGHENPEGLRSAGRLEAAGVSFAFASVNIAKGQGTPAEVMDAWMRSTEGHRENILSPNFTHAGVGVSLGAEGPWWVIVFYKPSAPTSKPVDSSDR